MFILFQMASTFNWLHNLGYEILSRGKVINGADLYTLGTFQSSGFAFFSENEYDIIL